jgi:hypothetical protein
MEPEQEIKGLASESESGLAVKGQLKLAIDIKTDVMTMYLLTNDRLESLKGGGESLDFTFFGAFLAIFLTLVGIAIPLYVTNATGRVFFACCILAPVFLLGSLYFGIRGFKIRTDFKNKIDDLKRNSKTVVEVVSKQ